MWIICDSFEQCVDHVWLEQDRFSVGRRGSEAAHLDSTPLTNPLQALHRFDINLRLGSHPLAVTASLTGNYIRAFSQSSYLTAARGEGGLAQYQPFYKLSIAGPTVCRTSPKVRQPLPPRRIRCIGRCGGGGVGTPGAAAASFLKGSADMGYRPYITS